VKGVDLADLSLPELQSFSNVITNDVFACLTLEGSVAARKHIGGTAPERVREEIKFAKARLDAL
jgi:argininosuccinate lyase